jgi:hypothetical protein
LGIDRIEPLQLEKGISGAIRITTQEPTKPVVKEEPKAKVTEPEVKVVEPKVEDKPKHTSFRKVDDPKRAEHQAKLDERRIFAEESMKKGLQSIDKLEELLQGKKPVSPASTPPVEAEIKTTPATWSNQDTDLPVDVFVDDNGTPISENGYTKVRYTAPDGKVTINYLPTTEITLDSDNDKRIKQLQDKASKSTLEELERIFKAVQVKITNKDSTTRTKEISDVYGSEITKRVAEMKEKDFMIKYTALRGSVAKGNTEDSPLLAIYDERFQKDLEEGTAAKANEEEAKVSTDISSNAKGLAGALTNPTELAKSKGNITESYPIEYGGKTYKDAEAVFQAIKDPTEGRTKPAREVSNNYSLMVAILKAKLKQYPALVAGITKQGGSKWILAATHQPTSKNTVWETGGENWFILALNEAYLSQVEPSKKETKIEPVTFTGKMTFAYGSNKRSDVESDTTFDAIKAGERTATTRYTTDGKIDYWSKAKVGDIIEFSNKDGDIVRVEVTKPLTKLPLNTDGETWSKKEGWSIDYFNKNVKPKLDKAYQLEYKLIGKPEPIKQDKATITKEEVSKLSVKELNSKINATFNKADIIILNNELISREVVLEGYDQPVLEEIKPAKAFELNDGQKKAFDKIMSFLDGSGITFTLTGSAGTGKTTLVNTIISALKKSGSVYGSVVLSAPTHRANAVTKSKNKDQKVMTLHQLLSLAPEVDLENFDASKVKFNQIEKEKDPFPKSGLIIIDESSMISDALYDFLMDKVSEFPDVKILFLGDAAQLRPVTRDNKSSLQDSKALTQTDGQANLTKVERAKNPELLDESINLREKGSFTNNNNMKNSNGVAFTNSEAGFINRLIRMFKSQEFADNRLLVRAVAYTNKRVTEINSKVRESLYGKDAPDYVVGDLLMGYNRFGKQDDKGNLPIANGIDYLVTSVGSEKTIDILGVQVKTANITIKDVYGLGGSNTLTVILPSNDASVWQSLGEKFQKLSTQAYAAKDKSIFDNEAR